MIAGTAMCVSSIFFTCTPHAGVWGFQKLTLNVLLDALVRQNAATVHVNLVANRHVVTKHRDVLETCPAAHGAVPAHNRALDPCVLLDLAALQQHTPLQPNTVTDDYIWPDNDVGSDAAVRADLGRRVGHDVAAVDVRLRGRSELLVALAGQRGEVEAGAGEEIFGLSDVHPEALEVKTVQLAVLGHGGEGLLLDRGRAQVDALQHAWVEDVDAGVDAVADELDGLLDEAVDARGVRRLVHDHAVFRWLFYLGHDDRALVAVRLVEVGELLEGVFADDVRVQHEEGGVVLAEDLFGELEGTGCAEGLGLDGEFNAHVVFLLVLGGLLDVCPSFW